MQELFCWTEPLLAQAELQGNCSSCKGETPKNLQKLFLFLNTKIYHQSHYLEVN